MAYLWLMQAVVFYPAILALLACLIASILTFNIYRKQRFIELLGLSFGFLCFAVHPLVFVIFSFYENEKYNDWRTIGLKLQLTIGIFGMFLLFIFIKNLTGEKYRRRQYVLIGLFLYSLGFSTNAIQSEWLDSTYYIIYVPARSSILLGVALAWTIGELIRLAYKSMISARSSEKDPFRTILLGWCVGLLSVVSQIFERIRETGSAFYLIPLAFSFIFIALALQKDPYAIVPRTIGAQTLIVSEGLSGIPFLTHEFKQDSNLADRDILFSSAMRGILALLEELTGQEDLPKQFGYVNASIIIEQSKNFICYLVCFRANNPVRSVMKKILVDLEQAKLQSDGPMANQAELIEMIIDKEMYFAV